MKKRKHNRHNALEHPNLNKIIICYKLLFFQKKSVANFYLICGKKHDFYLFRQLLRNNVINIHNIFFAIVRILERQIVV